MLSLPHRRKRRFGSRNANTKNKNKENRTQWPGDGYNDGFMKDDEDLEAGFARPREPIRVTMVQDEDVHVGAGGRDGVEDDDAEEKELPPPPPAYGLWRSSVVCPFSPSVFPSCPYHVTSVH